MLPWSVPNLLSALRIALAFVCLSVAASPGVYLALTAAAVATDYLDGLAARLLDQRSRFGVAGPSPGPAFSGPSEYVGKRSLFQTQDGEEGRSRVVSGR